MPHHSSACALFPRNFLHCIQLPPSPNPLSAASRDSPVACSTPVSLICLNIGFPTWEESILLCIAHTVSLEHISTCPPMPSRRFFWMYPFCVEVILSARMLELIMCAITNPLYDILPLCVCVWLSILHIKSSRSCSMNLYHLCGATEGDGWMSRTTPETETVGIGSPSSNESMEAALCYNYIQP